MGDILRFARDVLRGIGLALGMHPDTVQFVERHPETGWIIMVIAVLAGASTLLGQSVVLFLNRVQPTRFVVSLFLNGVILALSFLTWGVAIWLLGTVLLDCRVGAGDRGGRARNHRRSPISPPNACCSCWIISSNFRLLCRGWPCCSNAAPR